MRGLGTDNASVMTGVNNGVYQKLKEDIPHLILVRCVCHSVQLAVSDAVKEALPKNLEFLIGDTYAWFSRSADRQGHFQILYNTLNDGKDPLKIPKVAATRWLSIYVAVNRILEQWQELRMHFEFWKGKDKCYTSEVLFAMYSDIRNELYLLFLQPVLEEAQKVNKVFQMNENDPAKLLKSLTMLIQGLVMRIVISGCKENFLTINVRNYLHPKPNLGFAFEEKMKEVRKNNQLNVDEEKIIRSRCIDFIIALVKGLQVRLPDNVEVLEKVSLLCPEKCLRTVKPPITNLAKLMKVPTNLITKIDFQWLKINFVEWTNIDKTVPFWAEVLQYKDASYENPFQELANFAITCLVLPWSNAEIERSFSQMNIVKSPHRNRFNDETLIAILTIRAGLRRLNKCCSTYQFPPGALVKVGTLAAYNPLSNADKSTPNSEYQEFNDILEVLEPFEEQHDI
ncbi:uncharacterized protein LOC115885480 isoform X3 [Sitophilus oryzae]|nr:uncharacterized protein LOC115885480 isoform X3 [Sitophilus oryzae]